MLQILLLWLFSKYRPGATLKGGVDEFYDLSNARRSVRQFSSRPVDIGLVKKAILCAGTSPSGTFLCTLYYDSKLYKRNWPPYS
jgi:hypothetical protein